MPIHTPKSKYVGMGTNFDSNQFVIHSMYQPLPYVSKLQQISAILCKVANTTPFH